MIRKMFLFLVLACFMNQTSPAQGWSQQLGGFPSFWSISAVDTNTCFVAGDRMFVVKTTNAGGNWTSISDNGLVPGNYGAIFARSATLAWTANVNQIYKTTNGGTNWTKVYEYTGPGAQYCFFDDIYFWDDLTGVIFSDQVGANPNYMLILRTTDGGTTWNPITAGLPTGNALFGLAGASLDVVGNHIWYSVLSGTASDTTAQRFLIHSRDKGLTWESLPLPSYSGLYTASFSDSLKGVFIGGGNHVAQTSDGGRTWKVAYNSSMAWPMKFAKGTPNVWAKGPVDNTYGSTVSYSTDYGTTWKTQFKQAPAGINSFAIVNQTFVWACGQDWTIFRTRSAGNVQTSVVGDPLPLPATFELMQNYPNPFNPTTVIKFRLEKAGPVHLAIYDALGREVRTLIDEYEGPGWRQVVWNGRDNADRPVASGAYFYALRGENKMDAKKMILLK